MGFTQYLLLVLSTVKKPQYRQKLTLKMIRDSNNDSDFEQGANHQVTYLLTILSIKAQF